MAIYAFEKTVVKHADTLTKKNIYAVNKHSSWYEGVAKTWGSIMDDQVNKLEKLCEDVGNGGDQPSRLALLNATSVRFNYLAQSEQTSMGALGNSMESLARKQ